MKSLLHHKYFLWERNSALLFPGDSIIAWWTLVFLANGQSSSQHSKFTPTTAVTYSSPGSQNCSKVEIQGFSPWLFCRKTLATFVTNSNSKPYVSEKLFNNALLPNDFTNKTGIDEFQFRSGTARSTSRYWTLHWRMAAFIKSPGKSLIRWRIMALAAIFKEGWKISLPKANFSTKMASSLLYYWFHLNLTIQGTGSWSEKSPIFILK